MKWKKLKTKIKIYSNIIMNEKINIENLPNELIYKIFEYLRMEDIYELYARNGRSNNFINDRISWILYDVNIKSINKKYFSNFKVN